MPPSRMLASLAVAAAGLALAACGAETETAAPASESLALDTQSTGRQDSGDRGRARTRLEVDTSNSVLPSVQVKDVAGGEVDLATLVPSKTPILLWAWAPHCPICAGEAPAVEAFSKQHADAVTVVGSRNAGRPRARRGLRQHLRRHDSRRCCGTRDSSRGRRWRSRGSRRGCCCHLVVRRSVVGRAGFPKTRFSTGSEGCRCPGLRSEHGIWHWLWLSVGSSFECDRWRRRRGRQLHPQRQSQRHRRHHRRVRPRFCQRRAGSCRGGQTGAASLGVRLTSGTRRCARPGR